MITLVGVGHVFRIRDAVKHIICQRAPQVVGVELDELRFEALVTDDKDDGGSFMVRRLIKAQESISKKFGGAVGEEMLSAVATANLLGLQMAFIDIPATRMLKPLFNSLSLKEKVIVTGSAISAPFMPKKVIEKELKEFEENPDMVFKAMERVTPVLKRSLIDARDDYMANRLLYYDKRMQSVLAVIGDGHIPGISKRLRRYKARFDTIRLKEVREIAKRIPPEPPMDPNMLSLRPKNMHRRRFGFMHPGNFRIKAVMARNASVTIIMRMPRANGAP